MKTRDAPASTTASRLLRVGGALVLVPVLLWGCALGAWFSTALTTGLVAVIGSARGWKGLLFGAGLASCIVAVGVPEVLLAMDGIGERSRKGTLGGRDKAAVYGFNIVFGGAAIASGFPAFGVETLALAVPWSRDGACPADRLERYGRHLPRAYPGHVPRLRRWSSDFPLDSPRLRLVVARWAAALPAEAPDGARRDLAPRGPFTWPASAYIAANEANGVPVALNTPTTRMSGHAVRVGDRWRLDLSVDLALAYPEQATLPLGPFDLEEGMFHDARSVLHPYCLEYVWSVWADDPALNNTEPIRGPMERSTTWVLRELNTGYR